jgi:hypothetical protein
MREESSGDVGVLESVVSVAVTATVDVLWMDWTVVMVVTP